MVVRLLTLVGCVALATCGESRVARSQDVAEANSSTRTIIELSDVGTCSRCGRRTESVAAGRNFNVLVVHYVSGHKPWQGCMDCMWEALMAAPVRS